MRFRIATYNIRKCVGLDWRRRPDRIVRVLRELDADIVALQEADRRLGPRRATLCPVALREMAGMKVALLDAEGPNSGWHGNTILVREGIEVVATTPVDLPSLEPRGALVADLGIGRHRLRVAGVHLGLRSGDRRRQARALIAALGAHGVHGMTVIAGDLNEWAPEGTAMRELEGAFRPIPPMPSFHAGAPVAALDRILVGRDFQVLEAAVHRSELARRASDHLPVWADLLAVPERAEPRPATQAATEREG